MNSLTTPRYTALRFVGLPPVAGRRSLNEDLMKALDKTSVMLCRETEGAILAYTHSDEISLLLRNSPSDGMFRGNRNFLRSMKSRVQEIFANVIDLNNYDVDIKSFECYANDLPDEASITRYLKQARKEAIDNSVVEAIHNTFPDIDTSEHSTKELMALLFTTKNPWGKLPDAFRFGRFIQPENGVKGTKSRWTIEPAVFEFSLSLLKAS